MDEFLTELHNLKEQQKKQLEEDHEPKKNDFDPAWGEVNSLYGVKNNENRFVKVEPRDFVDFVRDDEWLDYFQLRVSLWIVFFRTRFKTTTSIVTYKKRLQRKELFNSTQKMLSDESCLLTLETRPSISVIGNGTTQTKAQVAAIKLAIYDLQVSCQ